MTILGGSRKRQFPDLSEDVNEERAETPIAKLRVVQRNPQQLAYYILIKYCEHVF
jgi:hypothetical protein